MAVGSTKDEVVIPDEKADLSGEIESGTNEVTNKSHLLHCLHP